ncbi:MAG: glutaminyl-tRNA synthase (glutamine-hydrolyzing) subunit B [Chloroflexi bacterium RBG_16_64_32]|nr:MAG: glutaminyl-tRNA synthase (glutamine-hydrolyzing) subunit B [Chloroflexi bacterium RBG_16_64_32]
MTTTAVQYETVIGLEVHAQLLTRSKMFCPCSSSYADSTPNTYVCPVCLGMPGVLPVINKRAVEMTIMTGLALNCAMPQQAKFDRKNYPYPDLMKGYQISEYDEPLCGSGWLEIEVDGHRKRIGVTRVHLEEDTAKLLHVKNPAGETYSLVDVNRSGVPLMEVVGEPDIRSPEEARAYLMKLRQILRYLDVCAGNMEEGNFRCDANISIRPLGSTELMGKVEVKNMNSFRSVHRALGYEAERQREVLDSGGRIPQETRGWVDDQGITVSQRSKEYAHDYRYFPEPDLPPIVVDHEWLEEIRAQTPELPDAKRARLQTAYGLSDYDVTLLTESRGLAQFFEDTVKGWKRIVSGPGVHKEISGAENPKMVANWVLGEFSGLLNAIGLDLGDPDADRREMKLTAANFAELLNLLRRGEISAATAKQVLKETFQTGRRPKEIVEEAGLVQITASDEISSAVERVIGENAKAADDYRGGKEEALKFLVGQVMRETRGRANPGLVNELLREKLNDGP